MWNTNCSSLEYQRFYAMNIWINQFPKLKFTGPSLSRYLDKLVNQSKTYKPSLMFDEVYLHLYGYTLSFDSYRANWTKVTLNQTDFSFIAFNSSQLRIDSQIKVVSQSVDSLVWVNFTFYLPKGPIPSVLKYNYNTSSTNFKNG